MKKQPKFTLREVVSTEMKTSVLTRVRNHSGLLTMSRRDFDGGEVLEFRLGKGKKLVVVEWNHWCPWEHPILTVSSNNVKAMASVLVAIVFDDQFFESISLTLGGDSK